MPNTSHPENFGLPTRRAQSQGVVAKGLIYEEPGSSLLTTKSKGCQDWTRLLPGWLLSLTLHGLFALTLTTIVTVHSHGHDARGIVGDMAGGGRGGTGLLDQPSDTAGVGANRPLSTELPATSETGWQHFRTTPAELNQVLGPAVQQLGSTGLGLPGSGITGDSQKPQGNGSGTGGTGSGIGQGGTGVGFFGTRSIAGTCLYVVDMSGSMQGRRFRRALTELNRSITALQPSQNFFVILFSDYAVPLFNENSLGSSRDYRGLTPIPATLTNKNRTHTWLKSMIADGETYPAEALKMALDMRPDVVFFLTDGEIPEDVPSVISAHNKQHVPIHVIGFENTAGAHLLRKLASENRGSYRYVR